MTELGEACRWSTQRESRYSLLNMSLKIVWDFTTHHWFWLHPALHSSIHSAQMVFSLSSFLFFLYIWSSHHISHSSISLQLSSVLHPFPLTVTTHSVFCFFFLCGANALPLWKWEILETGHRSNHWIVYLKHKTLINSV